MKSIKVSFCAVLLSSLIFSACSKKEAVSTNKIIMRLPGDPPSLDWNLATDNVSREIIGNIQEGLMGFDDETKIKTELAASWSRSADEKTYTFILRDGTLWSDGTPLTAQHFVDGWERLLNPKTASEYSYFLFDVLNAEEFNLGKISDFSKVGVKAIDAKTLQVTLKKPTAFWIQIPTFWPTYPIRKDLIEKYGDKWTQASNLVVVGPYTLKSWENDSKLVLQKNPNYFDKTLLADMIPEIEFRIVKEHSVAVSIFQTGGFDIVRDLPTQQIPILSSLPEFKKSAFLRSNYYGFNLKDPAVADVNIRKAIAHAIDRSEIIKIIGDSYTEASSWVPPGLFSYDSARGLKFNPTLAKEYWNKAKIKPNKIELWYNQDELNKLVAENVQNQLKRVLGLEAQLVTQEWKVYLKTLHVKTPPLYRFGWGADYPDPDTFMNLFTCNSGNNQTGFCNKKYDQLISDSALSSNEAERKVKYGEAERILLEEEVAIIPTFSQSNLHLVSRRVNNFHPNLLGEFKFKGIRLQK